MGKSKLGEKDVAIIRHELENGTTNSALAKRFGVSPASISLIKSGKNWKAKKDLKSRIFENILIDENQCWNWIGCIGNHGYGLISVGNKRWLAHRTSYELLTGKTIPPGMCICHHCDNRKCINPDHFFIGTRSENIKDAVKKDRHNRGERNHGAILSDGAVKAIRKLASTGKYFDKEIASFFDTSRTTITLIRQGKTWRHLLKDERCPVHQ